MKSMKVLIVARCKDGRYAPFVTEQVDAIRKKGVECEVFGVVGKGIAGYLHQLPAMDRFIRAFQPDIIHAHYGLCGLLANYQRSVPVVTTYHGSDINDPKVFRFSQKSIRLSRFNIFVSQENARIAGLQKNYAVIPCGLDLDDYPIVDKMVARQQMGLERSGKYVLFSGAFDNPVKNLQLAKEAIDLLPEAILLELKGYTRSQVSDLMQAVDVLLMTSLTEGSPQVIKEAMACGCPIVSVDVGDVKERIADINGCWISSRSPIELAECLSRTISFGKKTAGRESIIRSGLTNDVVAARIVDVYRAL